MLSPSVPPTSLPPAVRQAAYPIVVLGGGAAGFFGAIACAEANPGVPVLLLEKSPKLLSKVRVSGGGRCNVTHACESAAQLIQHYPRGGRQLKEAFQKFGVADTIAWFERGKA
jgi:predicted flavoprotein YhiN